MADIFISYAQKAPEPTQTLAADLSRAQIHRTGSTNACCRLRCSARSSINEIDEAKAVITIWSDAGAEIEMGLCRGPSRRRPEQALEPAHAGGEARQHPGAVQRRTCFANRRPHRDLRGAGTAWRASVAAWRAMDWVARAFERIENSTDIEDFEAFLADFGGDGKQFYIRLARKKIAELSAGRGGVVVANAGGGAAAAGGRCVPAHRAGDAYGGDQPHRRGCGGHADGDGLGRQDGAALGAAGRRARRGEAVAHAACAHRRGR